MLRWCALGTLAALSVAWISAMVHLSGRAPLGLTSLAVGAALGAVLSGVASWLHVSRRGPLVVGAVALALLAALAQHAWLYCDFRRQWREARVDSPQIAMFRDEQPWSISRYVAHEATPWQLALWGADAALIVGATAATMLFLRPTSGESDHPTRTL